MTLCVAVIVAACIASCGSHTGGSANGALSTTPAGSSVNSTTPAATSPNGDTTATTGASCPTPTGTPAPGDANTSTAASPNQPLPSFAAQAQWFNSFTRMFRLPGIAVKVNAPASAGQGNTLHVSLVRDRTGAVVVTRNGVIGTAGLTLEFPGVPPLPNDPNGPGDTYTVRACIDTQSVSVCDGPVWQVPLTQDYQNTLNSNVVRFAFDSNGLTPPEVNTFFATVDLSQAAADTNRALLPDLRQSGQFYNFTLAALLHTQGNPGSGAEFSVISYMRVLDTDNNTIVYMDAGPNESPIDDPNLPGNTHETGYAMAQGGNYQIMMYTFKDNQACELDRPCGPSCTLTINHASQDVLLTKWVDGCQVIPW